MVTPIVACLALAGLCAAAAEQHVSAALVSDREKIAAGDTFRVGILFKIPDRGHIYWLNPGDSGLPTSVEWSLPGGFEVGDLSWAAPAALYDGVLDETSFGYEHEVLLFSEVRAPKILPAGAPVPIVAKASWLVCLADGMCVPERTELGIELIAAGTSAAGASAPLFDAYAERTPRVAARLTVPLKVETRAGAAASIHVHLGDPWVIDTAAIAEAVFFPISGGAWRATPDPVDGHTLKFEPLKSIDGAPSGALRLPVVNAGGERRTVYVRVGG